jgi:hypothetical protein
MKKNYLLLLWLFAGLFIASDSNAQRACGTMQHLHEQLLADPALEQHMEQMELQTQQWIQHQRKYPSVQAVINIPVVVHVVYNTSVQNISDAQVLSQIAVLNEDFRKLNADINNTPSAFTGLTADCQLNFCLAQRDPNGNATTGIVRKQTTVTSFSTNDNVKRAANGGSDPWNTSQYLNIWVCNIGQGILGYAQFPGGSTATDGVVALYSAFGRVGTVNPPYHKGRTTTHEVGHWLNLRHIWGDANCGNDQVNDTPTQQTSNYGCPSFPKVTCSNGPNGDMFMNYMDYTDDLCMYMFTTGQSSRMSAAINTFRPGLLTSPGCTPPSGGGTTCNAPLSLNATAITTSSATISWSSASGAVAYNLNYRVIGATNWTSATTSSTSFVLSNLSTSTTYEYRVQTDCGTNGTSSFSATNSFTTAAAGCTDIYESNGSTSTAKTIAVNTDIFAVIGTSTDNDYYKFSTVSGSTNLKLTLDQLVADYDLRLLSSSGSNLSTSQLTGTSPESIIRNTNKAATYYARVYGYGGAFNASSCYRLRVNRSGTAFRNGNGLEEETFGNIVPEKMDGLDALQIWPNPVNDNLNLSFFTSEEAEVSARVFDMLGKVVHTHTLYAEQGFGEATIKTDNLPTGVYMIQLQSGAESVTKRFVVKH